MLALGIALHAVLAAWLPEPVDYDPAYYGSVARHVVAGDGAVTGALWTLLWRPDALPYAADTHWMPLPSRVLVPGVWLWPAHGDQAITVWFGALWGPLAFALARRNGASSGVAWAAGLFATTGLAYTLRLVTPDCIALFGVIGGLAWLAVFDKKPWAVAGLAVAAALTRNDGFLLAPCLALAFRGGPALGIAVVGPATAAVWALRNVMVVGPEWLTMRQRTTAVLDLDLVPLILGNAPPVGLAERFAFIGQEGAPVLALLLLLVVPFPGLLMLGRDRRSAAMAAAWLGVPLLALFLAPGVAASGSVFRWLAAVFPLACALTAQAFARLGTWSFAQRGLHPWFLPTLLAIPVLGSGLFLGTMRPTSPLPAATCAAIAAFPADAVVFSPHPLLAEASCGHKSVVLIPGMSASQVAELADKYHVTFAVVLPVGTKSEFALSPTDAAALLPGWRQLSPESFAAPDGVPAP